MSDRQCQSCGGWDDCPCGLDDWWAWVQEQEPVQDPIPDYEDDGSGP